MDSPDTRLRKVLGAVTNRTQSAWQPAGEHQRDDRYVAGDQSHLADERVIGVFVEPQRDDGAGRDTGPPAVRYSGD